MSPRSDGQARQGGEAIAFREAEPFTCSRPIPVIESLRSARSVAGEEFRLLRARLREAGRERDVRTIAVVSALPGEGKSTISLGLSSALAREPGRRILLAEADLRKPSISRALEVPPDAGLTEWLSGTSREVSVRAIEPGGFFFLGAGQAELERPEDLNSPRMQALVRSARESFDSVVLDATPILPVADAVMIQEFVDGLLLVVRSRVTPKEAIQDSLARIHPDKILGVVLNDHREYRHSYYTYGYHRYGMRS